MKPSRTQRKVCLIHSLITSFLFVYVKLSSNHQSEAAESSGHLYLKMADTRSIRGEESWWKSQVDESCNLYY